MSPKKKPYTGPDRRVRAPVNPGKTWIGLLMVAAGFVGWWLFHHETGEVVPVLMIGFGGVLVDKEVLKAPRALLPWKNGGGK